MVWGKKSPTEFDEAQDKQLQQLMTNQTVLIKNNAYFIEQNKKLWSWITNLNTRAKNLEARMTANEAKDKEQAELFANLSRTTSQTETVEETT